MTRVETTDEMKQRTIARQWAAFDRRACHHFRALHGDKVGWLGEDVLDHAAREGVKAAQRWGNDSVGGMLDYLTLVYMMGHEFANDPQYQSWVGLWVKHTDDTGERLKTEHLIVEALDLIPEFNPSPALWLNALDAADALLEAAQATAPAYRMSEADARNATVSLLGTAWPKRMEHLSEEELSAKIPALNPVLGKLGCKTPRLFAVGTLLALHFGIGFLRDPRYPIFAEIADRGELTGKEKLCLLIQTARELELYPDKRSSG